MEQKKQQPNIVVLLVLDGWGISPHTEGNAIKQASTPVLDKLLKEEPHAILGASGESVGLPHGFPGNSEVGHMHLGAGRIVRQDLTRINEAIESGTFYQNPVFISAVHHARSNGSKLHLMGLLSHGGVHSEASHLYALLELIKEQDFEKDVFLHIFTDGRDCPPQSAQTYIEELEGVIDELGIGKIATVAGRHYAMDRAHNWDRIKGVYEAIVEGKGPTAHNINHVLREAYQQDLNDQRIPPTVIVDKESNPITKIDDDDVIIFFNQRSDRARQLTKPFVLQEFDMFTRNKVLHELYFVGMTNFGDDLPMSIAFPADRVHNALPEVLADVHDLEQLYIAEEEKYSQVSYFFRGGSSLPFKNEERVMVNSIDNALYTEHPEMSSNEVTRVVIQAVKTSKKDRFILANFPNADVLGHSGDIDAAKKGIEKIDTDVGKIVEAVQERGGSVVITSDHGNAERMIDPETDDTLTSHSANPVPCIVVTNREVQTELPESSIANIAPTILDLLHINPPEEMDHSSLLQKNTT